MWDHSSLINDWTYTPCNGDSLFLTSKRFCIGVKVKVAQSCPTFCDPKDYTVHEILQARILEWVAIPFSKGIFPTQGSNPGLPHCRWIPYQLSHHGSPGFIWGLSILFHWSIYLFFVPIPHCLDNCSFVVLSEVWKNYASNFVLALQECFSNSGSFVVPYKF